MAAVLAVLIASVGCDDPHGATHRSTAGRSATASALPADLGPEVVDGILYPPGIPVDEGSAVGRTRTGWVISSTSDGEDNHVSVVDGAGHLLAEGSALGVGMADPTGDLAAWVESRNDGDIRHLVVVDTVTGKQLERRSLDQGSVAAVHGDEIVLAGGAGGITVHTVGSDPEPLPVDGDQVVWGYDGAHLVTGDFDHTVTVTSLDGQDTQSYEAVTGFLSPGTGQVALLGEDGLVVLDLATAASVSLPVEDAGVHIVWTATGDLVVRTGGLLAGGEEAMGERFVCLGGTADCRPAPSTRPGEQTLFYPADALTNTIARL